MSIKKKEVLKILNARYEEHLKNGDSACADTICDMQREIEDLPETDDEEVVRCKDCDRSAKYKDYYLCGVDNRAVNADSFCSYGERRDT